MAGLTARRLSGASLLEGVEAEVLLTEPVGTEHILRCLCKLDGSTDIGDPTGGRAMQHLTTRYGEQVVWALSRQMTLGEH
jgi:hypothetical protein